MCAQRLNFTGSRMEPNTKLTEKNNLKRKLMCMWFNPLLHAFFLLQGVKLDVSKVGVGCVFTAIYDKVHDDLRLIRLQLYFTAWDWELFLFLLSLCIVYARHSGWMTHRSLVSWWYNCCYFSTWRTLTGHQSYHDIDRAIFGRGIGGDTSRSI